MYFLVLDDKVQDNLLQISQDLSEARDQKFLQTLKNCLDLILEHPLAMPSIGVDNAFPDLYRINLITLVYPKNGQTVVLAHKTAPCGLFALQTLIRFRCHSFS